MTDHHATIEAAKVPRSGTRWQTAAPPVAVAIVALMVRMIHVWNSRDVPTIQHLIGDAAAYYQWSQRIAGGDWLGNAGFYQAPLYPYVLAAAQVTGVDSVQGLRFLQCVWGAVASGLLVIAGWNLLGRAAGVLAGLMLALYGPAIYFDGIIQKATLDNLLVCALLASLGLPASRFWMAAVLGAIASLLCLTRENALVWHLVLPMWLAMKWRDHCGAEESFALPVREPARIRQPGDVTRALGAYVIGAAVVLALVAGRNWYVQGEFALTTFQAGPNFYIGNHHGADGRYQPLARGHETPVFEQRDATELAEKATGRELSPKEVSRYWMRRAWEEIVSDPVSWLGLMGYKLLLTWNRYEISDAESIVVYRGYSPILRATSTLWHFGTLAPLAVLGVVLTWSQRRRLWILHTLIVTLTLAVTAFYVLARYRFPLTPLLILFAAAGCIECWRRLRQSRSVLGPAVLAMGFGVLFNWPIQDEQKLDALAEMNAGVALAEAGMVSEASDFFARAVAGHPTSAEANYNLAMSLAIQGKYSDAIPHYEQALRVEPKLPGGHFNLAVALERTGNGWQAKKHYESAVEQDPADLEAKKALRRLEPK